MDGSQSAAEKSTCGVGTWMKKNRYEEEEFSLSPPTDDSGYLPLRFGVHQPKHHESMYDRINRELGFAIETTKAQSVPGNSIISDSLTSLFGVRSQLGNTTPPHPSLQSISVVTEVGNACPKVVIPETIRERKESGDVSQAAEERPELSRVALEDVDTLVSKARRGRPTRKISMNLESTIDRTALLQSFQGLAVNSIEGASSTETEPQEQSQSALPFQSPFIEGLKFPTAITERRRKTSAPPSLNPMLMDRSSNFFFTGGLFTSGRTSSITTLNTSEEPSLVVAASTMASGSLVTPTISQSEPTSPNRQVNQASLAQTTRLMEERATEAAGLEPKQRMGRRPKPSTLRELNFLAPQSM